MDKVVCSICGMGFTEEKRLIIHFKTHQNKKEKVKKAIMPDFGGPDFSQVM